MRWGVPGIRGLLLVVFAPAVAAATASGVSSWQVDRDTTGLLVEDHRAPLVTVHLEFPAGSWSPWVRQSEADRGFVLQLHDAAGRLRREADRLGLDATSTVGPRAAILRATCLKQDLAELLALFRGVLRNDELDRREIRRSRGTERLDWRFAVKDPRFRAIREHARLLFEPGDPRLRRYEPPDRIRGNAAELVRARDLLLELPGRLLAFAGDLSRSEARRAGEALLPAARREVPDSVPPQLLPLRAAAGRDDVEVPLAKLTQVYFSYGRESLPYDDADYPAFLLADHVLGGHFYSRLNRALRHEGGETYGASSTNLGDVAHGLYSINTFTRSANAALTERKLRLVLARFHGAGITESERVEALGFLQGRLAFSRQSPQQILDRHLRERRLGLREGFFDDLVERAARLDLNEINDLIRRYFDPSRFVMVRVVPAGDSTAPGVGDRTR